MAKRLNPKKRLSPRVDAQVVRRAKSKAAFLDITLEGVIEALLSAWVEGQMPDIVVSQHLSETIETRTGE